MEIMLFAFRDDKVQAYGAPFTCRGYGDAERHATTVANDKKTQIGLYPKDFSLYHMGIMDDSTGAIHTPNAPQLVKHCIDLVRQNDEQ